MKFCPLCDLCVFVVQNDWVLSAFGKLCVKNKLQRCGFHGCLVVLVEAPLSLRRTVMLVWQRSRGLPAGSCDLRGLSIERQKQRGTHNGKVVWSREIVMARSVAPLQKSNQSRQNPFAKPVFCGKLPLVF